MKTAGKAKSVLDGFTVDDRRLDLANLSACARAMIAECEKIPDGRLITTGRLCDLLHRGTHAIRQEVRSCKDYYVRLPQGSVWGNKNTIRMLRKRLAG